MATLIVLGVVALVVLITLARAIRIVPQARAGIVERLGRYQPHAGRGPGADHPVRRPGEAADRPA